MEIRDLALLGAPRRSIRLRTRAGREVPNYIASESSEEEVADYRRLRKATWVNRRGPGGGYNCFGHVFAARRCTIEDPENVDAILRDDGYQRQGSVLTCRPGDVVLWRLGGEVAHVAVVLSPNPFVLLSKWNEAYGEDEHPYTEFLGDLLKLAPTVECWRHPDDHFTSAPSTY